MQNSSFKVQDSSFLMQISSNLMQIATSKSRLLRKRAWCGLAALPTPGNIVHNLDPNQVEKGNSIMHIIPRSSYH